MALVETVIAIATTIIINQPTDTPAIATMTDRIFRSSAATTIIMPIGTGTTTTMRTAAINKAD